MFQPGDRVTFEEGLDYGICNVKGTITYESPFYPGYFWIKRDDGKPDRALKAKDFKILCRASDIALNSYMELFG